jgi:hypothetical protein
VRNYRHTDGSECRSTSAHSHPPVGEPQFLLCGHRKEQKEGSLGGGVSSHTGVQCDRRRATAFG